MATFRGEPQRPKRCVSNGCFFFPCRLCWLFSHLFSYSTPHHQFIPRVPEPLGSPRSSVKTIGRTESQAHLTINAYMQGINESADEGDDGDSLFF